MNEEKIINTEKQNRNSSIEMLKIIGIILIVINHVVQTLHSPNEFIDNQDYIVDLSLATNNIQYLILAMLRSSGSFGNALFFICSAWFLLEKNNVDKKKIFQFLVDIWVISMTIFAIVYFLRDGNISLSIIIKQIFPTTFMNNWYMTCYILFYPLHPYLNTIIKEMDKKTLLRTSIILSFLYLGMNYIKEGLFFSSALILWVTIYFVIGYIKYYLKDFSNSIKKNIIIVIIGFIGNFGIIFVTNIIGMHIEIVSNQLLRWGSNCSPFIILMVIGMINIARNINYNSKVINYLSSLSLLIYILHENMLLRIYYRPLMWEWVYKNFGYDQILLWTLIIVAIVLVFGLITSILYKNTIQVIITKIIGEMYPLIRKSYGKIEDKILKIQ